jgi:hypothetical protein
MVAEGIEASAPIAAPENLSRDVPVTVADHEAGDGNRGRRDRRRRGNRADRPEGESGPAASTGQAAVAEPLAQADTQGSPPFQAPLAQLDHEPRPPQRSAEESETAPVRQAVSSPVTPPPAVATPEGHPVATDTAPGREARPERRPQAPVARRVVPDLPPVTLDLPPGSGLVLVETSHRVEAAPPEEGTTSTGPRRPRRPRVQLVEEPLQIVETRKDSPPAS